MRFLVDEDLSTDVARIGRALGLDIISVHEVGRGGLSDPEQLEYAATEGRCMVTRNRNDFIRWTDEFAGAGRPHAGVVIVPRSLLAARSDRIAHALQAFSVRHGDGDTAYLCTFLSP